MAGQRNNICAQEDLIVSHPGPSSGRLRWSRCRFRAQGGGCVRRWRFRLTASKCDTEEGERGGPASVPHHV